MKKKLVNEIISYLLIIIFVVLFRTFILTPVRVKGPSMIPNLKEKDVLLLNKLKTSYKRGDIVVIKLSGKKEEMIKRIIGLPGDTIEIEKGVVYINTKKLEEPYKKGMTGNLEAIKLKENEYYVLGDNRGLSMDSRLFGPVTKKEIKGKTKIRIYPFNKIGKI